MSRFELHQGDCLATLRGMADNSVDSIVTDPPYGLSFMGKKWDYDVPATDVWVECLRVLKPGGHLLAFAGTRTQHRMAVRIEDAGFEIRDMIAWVYGSGFPKSHNGPWGGTALKPALEPITMARKPLAGTVADNVLEWGTGGLNIDGCRIDGEHSYTPRLTKNSSLNDDGWTKIGWEVDAVTVAGRWPANLIHDGSDEVLVGFPETSSGGYPPEGGQRSQVATYGAPTARGEQKFTSSEGSAARFFYCAKADRGDRDAGLHGFEQQEAAAMQGNAVDGQRQDGNGKPIATRVRANIHPTVKPTDLMRYLCRLVTPAGGTVLDPFNGSGSTGKAAVLEGFHYIGCEREAEYIEISRARIEYALALAASGAEFLKPASERDAHTVDLFTEAA